MYDAPFSITKIIQNRHKSIESLVWFLLPPAGRDAEHVDSGCPRTLHAGIQRPRTWTTSVPAD